MRWLTLLQYSNLLILYASGSPYMDSLIVNVQRRFEDAMGVLTACTIFQPVNLPPANQLANYGTDQLEVLIAFYGN